MKKTILFILIACFSINAQIVYEPLYKDVYKYLDRLSSKGVVEYDDLLKPLSKKYISNKLLEAKNNVDMLTSLEKEELEFFLNEYLFELEDYDITGEKRLNYFDKDAAGRYRGFSYSDEIFKFNINPVIGYDISFPGKKRAVHNWIGVNAYSYLLNTIGISVDVRINNEHGNGIDFRKDFTPETGVIPVLHDFGKDIDYSEIRSVVSADWGWGNAVVAKDFLEYGYAQSGNIVLSDKAPSFPFIRLQLKPVDWLNFNYFHAWLSSNVIDSVNFEQYRRDIFINKYFAWHALTFTPLKGLDISLGESIVYSNEIELIYLMPFMFFYYADDFVSNRVNKPGDANSQIFFTIGSRGHIKNTHLYGTLFVDELTLKGINGTFFISGETLQNVLDKRKLRTQLGYTLGVSVTGLPFDNLTFTTEYTRLNPFIYGHHDPAQTYESSSYLMGHWMGHNSDLLFVNLNYRFLRGLQADIYGQYIRKGSSDYNGQYIQPQPEFLFGLKNYFKYFGFNLKYEFIHDLNLEFGYRYSITSNEQSVGIFKDIHLKEFSFKIYYGL